MPLHHLISTFQEVTIGLPTFEEVTADLPTFEVIGKGLIYDTDEVRGEGLAPPADENKSDARDGNHSTDSAG